MSDRRSAARAQRLLDPVWHKMRTALDRLYAEIELDAQPGALSVTVQDAGGTVITYTVVMSEPATVLRHILTDEQGIVDALDASAIDASVTEAPNM